MLDNDYPLMSLAAARALLEIEPEMAIAEVLDRLDTPGWPMGRISQLLKPAAPEVLRKEIALALDTWPSTSLPRLLQVIHALADSEFSQASRRVLQRFPEQVDLLSLILRLDDNPAIYPLAIRLCQHRSSQVRQAALIALGHTGSLADQSLLLEHLRQDDWMLQQAAAQALIHLPGMHAGLALSILDQLPAGAARLHWQEALHQQTWLPAGIPLELPHA